MGGATRSIGGEVHIGKVEIIQAAPGDTSSGDVLARAHRTARASQPGRLVVVAPHPYYREPVLGKTGKPTVA